MSTNFVKAGDGELYPITIDESVFEKNIIGNYRANEDLFPQIKFKDVSEHELAVQEVSFPIISEDERYRNVPNKIALILKDFFSDETGFLFGILSMLLGLIIPNVGTYLHQGYIDMSDLRILNECIGVGLSLGAYILFLVLLNKLCGLKAYGLSKDTDIWTIDVKDETVVRARLISVSAANSDFKMTQFSCDIDGSEYYLTGDDIYFSEEAAMNVLDFVLKSNDSELKKYYPNWKNDSNFVKFYKSTIYTYGFGRAYNANCYKKLSSAILADSVEINGMTYIPQTSITDLFTTYLSAVKRQEEAEKETQKLIDKINDYQSSIN